MTNEANAKAGAAGRFTFPGTNLTVNRMGYGAMRLSGPHIWGPPEDVDGAVAVLREALALGVDHIDTSDFYGPHATNQIIRKALHPYAKGLVIVTKIGGKRGADKSWNPAYSEAELRGAIDDNLKNLGLDAMDVVNLRMFDKDATGAALTEPLRVLVDMKRQGLVRHIGLSHVSAAQVRVAREMTEIVCVQNEYNLANRADDALVGELAKDGIAYVPYFPLGGFSPLQSSTLDRVAQSVGATPMQVALAWLLHRAPNVLVIPGTSSVDHLRSNVAAAALQLPESALRALDDLSAPAKG